MIKERRKHPRLRIPIEAEYLVAGRSDWREGTIWTLGAGGAALLCEERLEKGTALDGLHFVVEREGELPETRIEVAAEVVSIERKSDLGRPSNFMLGLRFTGLGEQEFELLRQFVFRRLTGSRQPASGGEGTPREESGQTPIEIRYKLFDEFVEEVSDNISPSGMFIRAHRPLPPGSRFLFQFQLGDDFSLFQGTAEVVWTRRRSDDPERPPGMGVRFLKLDLTSQKMVRRLVGQRAEGTAGEAGEVPDETGAAAGDGSGGDAAPAAAAILPPAEEAEPFTLGAPPPDDAGGEARQDPTSREAELALRVAGLEERLGELKAAREEAEERAARLEEEAAELRRENRTLEGSRDHAEEARGRAEVEAAELLAELETLRPDGDMEDELRQVREELESRRRDWQSAEAELERRGAVEAELRQRLEQGAATEAELRRELRQAEELEAELRAQLEEREAAGAELDERLSDAEAVEAELRQQASEASAAHEEMEERLARGSEIEKALREQARELRAELEQTRHRLAGMRAAAEEMRSRLNGDLDAARALESELASRLASVAEVGSSLEAKMAGVAAARADLGERLARITGAWSSLEDGLAELEAETGNGDGDAAGAGVAEPEADGPAASAEPVNPDADPPEPLPAPEAREGEPVAAEPAEESLAAEPEAAGTPPAEPREEEAEAVEMPDETAREAATEPAPKASGGLVGVARRAAARLGFGRWPEVGNEPAGPRAGSPLEAKTTPVAQPEPVDETEIEETVKAWVAAWSEQRVDDYLAFYSREFEAARPESDDDAGDAPHAWLPPLPGMDLTLGPISRTELAPGRFAVRFEQSVETDSYTRRTNRTLEMVREADAWKIAAESFQEL